MLFVIPSLFLNFLICLLYDQSAADNVVEILMLREVFLQDLLTVRCNHARFAVPGYFLYRNRIHRFEVFEVIGLDSDRVNMIVLNRHLMKVKLAEAVCASVIHNLQSIGELIELRMSAVQCLVTQHIQDHPPELGTADITHIYRLAVRETFSKIGKKHDRSQRGSPNTAGTKMHLVHTQAVLKNFGK